MSKTWKDRDKRDPRGQPLMKSKKNKPFNKKNPFEGLTEEEITLALKVVHFK